MDLYIVRKFRGKKYLFLGSKRIGFVQQDWVKIGDEFQKNQIQVEGRASGFRPGWHQLSLDNDFTFTQHWTEYRVLIMCPVCKKFTH